jgi:basic membrane protein A and related proteins
MLNIDFNEQGYYMVSKTIIAIVAVVVVVLVAAGLYIAMQPPVVPPKEKIKVAFLLPGSITDAGWNAATYQAAQTVATEMSSDIEVTIAEGLGQVGVEPTMRDFAARGYKILFCWTIQYQDPALLAAVDYPDTWFIISSAFKTSNNVISSNTNLWDGAYLAGIVAAGLTNTSKIGGIGGFNYTTTRAVPQAFFAGAHSVNPAIQTVELYAGVWDDLGKGREAADAMIGQGVDVIIARGDGMTLGVIQGASIASHPGTNHTVYMVGDMADQHALAPKTIVTSNLFGGARTLRNFIQMYMNGTMQSNSEKGIRVYGWGVKELCGGIAPFYGLDYKVPAIIKNQLAQAIADMMAGRLWLTVASNGLVTVHRG